ncbi:MAG: ribosome recycling factor [Saprospiraceae bacterium]|nr:ribosome recycling factor [Saprospiraceae bacterium]
MSEDIDSYLKKGTHFMDDAIEHLHKELVKIRTGKASPAMLRGLLVEYYGSPTPLSQVANVNAIDAKTLSIQPWEKSMLGTIEQAIFAANLGLTPMNDGEFIRITIPPLTEERRRDLVKQAKNLGEEAKISLRNARHKLMDFIKNEVKNGYPEDIGKRREAEVEKLVHDYADKVDKLIDAKEKDIMTV